MTYRPRETYWPYVQITEHPSDEELAALDPDLRAALFGPTEGRFSVSLEFPAFEGAAFDRALELAGRATEMREIRSGDAVRYRVRFLPSQALELRDLFEVVSPVEGTEVLVDDRPVPYARELWLPLVWFLIPRG